MELKERNNLSESFENALLILISVLTFIFLVLKIFSI